MTRPIIFCLSFLLLSSSVAAQSRKAPPGLFKDVNDTITSGTIIVRTKQLFIDNYLIAKLKGLRKRLNHPVKHPKNPVLVKDRPFEASGPGYGTVHYDRQEKIFKMWYQVWREVKGTSTGLLHYATSKDGVKWTKPALDKKTGANLVQHPNIRGFQCPGIFKDLREKDPTRRYKMLFSCNPDGTAKTWMTSVAFSPDGLNWRSPKETALVPFSDTQICPFWEPRSQRYVAILRFGPPNVRLVSRTESEDFLHWSPKITVLRRTKMDGPQATQFYQMAPMSYAGVYLGIIGAYHRESLKPITADKPWTDRQDLQLAFSRDTVVWSRVGGQGVIRHASLNQTRNWKPEVRAATFLPYGNMKKKEWDWGYVTPYYLPDPIVVKDKLYFYYAGQNAKHWWTWTGDPPKKDPNPTKPKKGVGLATLRLDGFVSVEAGSTAGTMTTRKMMFIGDTLEINANAKGGSITVEALDSMGKPIKGFTLGQSVPLKSNSVRHVLRWRGHKDLHQIQGRPIQLRFHLTKASLYSFTPRTRHKHYVQAYD